MNHLEFLNDISLKNILESQGLKLEPCLYKVIKIVDEPIESTDLFRLKVITIGEGLTKQQMVEAIISTSEMYRKNPLYSLATLIREEDYEVHIQKYSVVDENGETQKSGTLEIITQWAKESGVIDSYFSAKDPPPP